MNNKHFYVLLVISVVITVILTMALIKPESWVWAIPIGSVGVPLAIIAFQYAWEYQVECMKSRYGWL